MSKTRIAVISYWYPTHNSYQGTFVRDIAKSMSHEAAVAVYHLHVHRGKGFFSIKKSVSYQNPSIAEHHFEISGITYKFFYLFPTLVWLLSKQHFYRTIIREFNPDILHAHTVHPAGRYARLAGQAHNRPYAITEHWSKAGQFLLKGFGRRSGIQAYQDARSISCVSPFLGNNLLTHLPNLRIDIIANPVDEVFQPNPNKSKGPKTLVCCAHWKSPKRPDLIFQGLNFCAEKFDFELIVIGTGSALDALGSSWKFPIRKMGNLERNEIAQILQRSHGFVHASDIETFGIVVAEAIQSGLPICASNVGALPDMITKDNGILVNNDPVQWQKSLELFLSHDWNYQNLASTGTRYSAKNIGHQYCSWLTSALTSSGSRE